MAVSVLIGTAALRGLVALLLLLLFATAARAASGPVVSRSSGLLDWTDPIGTARAQFCRGRRACKLVVDLRCDAASGACRIEAACVRRRPRSGGVSVACDDHLPTVPARRLPPRHPGWVNAGVNGEDAGRWVPAS